MLQKIDITYNPTPPSGQPKFTYAYDIRSVNPENHRVALNRSIRWTCMNVATGQPTAFTIRFRDNPHPMQPSGSHQWTNGDETFDSGDSGVQYLKRGLQNGESHKYTVLVGTDLHDPDIEIVDANSPLFVPLTQVLVGLGIFAGGLAAGMSLARRK